MANEPEIRVNLRIAMDALRKDMRDAAASMKADMAKAWGQALPKPQVTAAAVQAVKAPVAQAAKVQAAAPAAEVPVAISVPLKDMAEENAKFAAEMKDWFAKAKAGQVEVGPASEGDKWKQDMSQWFRDASKDIREAKPTQTVGDMFQEWLDTKIGGVTKTIATLFAGLAAFRVAIGLAAFALRTLLAPVMALVRMFQQAADQARRYYASALSSGGMPLGFITHRNILADIIGVGQESVWQYGKAIQALTGRIRLATENIRVAVPTLTSLGWEWRALKHDMDAIRMTIAGMMAPVMSELLLALRNLTQGFLALSPALRKAWDIYNMLWNPTRWALGKFALSQMPGGGKAPGVEAWSKRLPTSEWERMGLVLGMGGRSPTQEIAHNTKRTADAVESIARKGGGGLTKEQINQMHPKYFKSYGWTGP